MSAEASETVVFSLLLTAHLGLQRGLICHIYAHLYSEENREKPFYANEVYEPPKPAKRLIIAQTWLLLFINPLVLKILKLMFLFHIQPQYHSFQYRIHARDY